MKLGSMFHCQLQCLYSALDTCLAASDVLMLLHRDVVAEFRHGFFQIRLYRRLIFAVYQDSGIFDTIYRLSLLVMVHHN